MAWFDRSEDASETSERFDGVAADKVYWIDTRGLMDEMNDELARRGGRVTDLKVTRDKYDDPLLFVVARYPDAGGGGDH